MSELSGKAANRERALEFLDWRRNYTDGGAYKRVPLGRNLGWRALNGDAYLPEMPSRHVRSVRRKIRAEVKP